MKARFGPRAAVIAVLVLLISAAQGLAGAGMDVQSGHQTCHGIEQVVGRGASWRQRRPPLVEQFFGHVNTSILENTNSFKTAGECLFIVPHRPAAVQLRERNFRV